jgi:hypothetical protein
MSTGALPPVLFDRARIAARRARAAQTPDFVTELVLDDLAQRLETVKRRFKKAALIGPTLKGTVPDLPSIDAFDIIETLVPEHTSDMPQLVDSDYDLIVSLLDLQVVNDVPGTLARLRRHLCVDGLFLSAAIGGDSLTELRQAWLGADAEALGGAQARIAPFMDVRDAGGLLQRAGYAIPVSDTDVHMVRYADPLALMRELKSLGAANPMAEVPGRPVTKSHLTAALAAYPLDADGRITATLELIWMSGWRPEET